MPKSMPALDRLRTIIATQQAIISCHDLDDVLQKIVSAVQAITLGDGAVVEVVDGSEMVYRAVAGSAVGHLGLRLSRATSLSGRCVREVKALRCDDSETDLRVDAEACRKVGARSMVVVPLFSHDVAIGALKAMSSRLAAFDEIDVEAMDLLSRLATSQIVRAEDRAALAASEQRFRGLIESANDAVLVVDASGMILMNNPSAARIYGYAELEGVPWSQLMPERDREGPAQTLAALAGTVRLEGLRGDGSTFPLELSVSSWLTADREPRFTCMVRDVSERLRLEQQAHIASRLTSVGTLAAGVAHEINNPLSYVLANLEMALEEIGAMAGESPPGASSARWKELTDMLGESRQGAERVRAIVRDLKTFSRADAVQRTVVDVHAVLELAINLTFHELRHRARIVKDFGSIPLVEADDARLGQVFVNLLVNAAHAIARGTSGEHEVRITTLTDAQGRAVVEMRDTGHGIPAAVLGRVFDPFFTTKPVGVGTGLGLAVCHSIVTELRGEITVTSDVGRGACFRVALPPAAKTPSKPLSARSLTHATGVAQLLVIDDEPAVALSLARILRAHQVTCVHTALEALQLLEEGRRFDVIFSDLMMPHMSGAQLFEQIERRFPEVAPRVVFATGGATLPTVREFLARVPNERVDKPFDVRAIRALVTLRLQR